MLSNRIEIRSISRHHLKATIDKNRINHKEGNDYNVYPLDKMLRAEKYKITFKLLQNLYYCFVTLLQLVKENLKKMK